MNKGELSPSSSDVSFDRYEDLKSFPLAPPRLKTRKQLCNQLSMCETPRDVAWEKRRRQILNQEQRMRTNCVTENDGITDEDLSELKGCIELGFGFKEEDGQQLCNTLPALDIYFAVNRQLFPSPVTTPKSRGSSSSPEGRSSLFGSPRSDAEWTWKICNPGDDPQHVKTKLRHWAQAVACSVMQSK